MSKAAKQCILILIIVLVLSLGFAAFSFMQKKKLESANARLQTSLQESEDREKQGIVQSAALKKAVDQVTTERNVLQSQVEEAKKQVDDFSSKINALTLEQDQGKQRVELAEKNRKEASEKQEALNQQIEELNKQIAVYKENVKTTTSDGSQNGVAQVMDPSLFEIPKDIPPGTDDYWAAVLKVKAALEMKLNNLSQELLKRSEEIIGLKQKNTNLQMQMDNLQHDKDAVDREIKYRSGMINSLAMELAQTKNDKRFSANQMSQLSEENTQLRQKIKELVDVKAGLENSMLHLNQERNEMANKLGESQGLVQNKIDEIWQAKENLERTFKKSSNHKKASPQTSSADKKETELQPIVVSNSQNNFSGQKSEIADQRPGFNGRVLSINEDNNFLIVSIGQKSGLRAGDMLSVYHDAQYIGRVEVIQVRNDIAAVDLKDQWMKVQVGDTVR